MAKPKQKVLYFINGPVPSDADRAEAAEYEAAGHRIHYRNALYVIGTEAPEAFDRVAGKVPDVYARAAAAKPDPDTGEAPKADAAAVPLGSPLAAPEGEEGAKPKQPKADAAKGWKPNA